MSEKSAARLDCGKYGVLIVEATEYGLALVTLEEGYKDSGKGRIKPSSTLDGLGISLRRMSAAELAEKSTSSLGSLKVADPKSFSKSAANLICGFLSGDEATYEKIKELPIDESALPKGFSGKVLKLLRHVPPGCYITYGDLAEAAGSPKAARAVGAAMASNPLLIAVPCHRVYGEGGRFTGFGGGLGLKAALASLEEEN